MIDTVFTPFKTDSVAVCNFGIIPPVIVPSAINVGNDDVVIVSINCLFLSRTPVTSVRSKRRFAFIYIVV